MDSCAVSSMLHHNNLCAITVAFELLHVILLSQTRHIVFAFMDWRVIIIYLLINFWRIAENPYVPQIPQAYALQRGLGR